MSKAEILAELPKLAPGEREQIFERLCQLREDELLRGAALPATEKKLLDEAIAEFERDGNPGRPWRTVLQRLRSNTQS